MASEKANEVDDLDTSELYVIDKIFKLEISSDVVEDISYLERY